MFHMVNNMGIINISLFFLDLELRANKLVLCKDDKENLDVWFIPSKIWYILGFKQSVTWRTAGKLKWTNKSTEA